MGYRLLIGVYSVVFGFYEVVPFFYIMKGFVLIFEVRKFGCVWFVFQFVCFGESLFFSCTSVYLGDIGIESWLLCCRCATSKV